LKKASEDPNQPNTLEPQDAEASVSQCPAQHSVWQYRDMLLCGQPIIFTANQPEAEREILGQWVADAMRAAQDVHLTNAILVGHLDAQAISAAREVVLRNCVVRDSVADFAHSIFLQRADFSGTHFAHGAVFARCRFDADVMLNDCHISGPGVLFMDAEVKRALMAYRINCDPGTEANFQRGRFYSIVKFPGSIFSGKVDFNGSIFDGQATFCGVIFRREASFGSCTFHETALFCGGSEPGYGGTRFEGDATFVSVRFGDQAAFQGAVFKKTVSFNLSNFEGFAYFNSLPNDGVPAAAFDGKADLTTAHFLGQANFQGVTFTDSVSFNSCVIGGAANFGVQLKAAAGCKFMGSADFAGLRCENVADFRGSVFHKQVDFRNATFKQSGLFTGELSSGLPPVVFHSAALFGNSTFVGTADFRKAIFKARVSFNGARMEQGAFFCGFNPEQDQGVRFEGEAHFSLAQINIAGNFRRATFMKSVSFAGATIDGPALFEGVVFHDSARFSLCRLNGVSDFGRAEFAGDLSLNEASTKVLRFSLVADAKSPDQFKAKVDLRGCTYDRIEVDWLSLLKHMAPYDRQPCVQLEKALRTSGEDSEADAVYLFRREAERHRQWNRREMGPWCFSWTYKILANYGVKPYRLILYSAAVLMFGAYVFLQPHAVSSKAADLPSSTENIQLGFYDAFAVSVHQFLPIDTPMGQEWTPSNRDVDIQLGRQTINTTIPFSAVATILKVIGWILLPAGVAALTGLFRRAA
jgi:uncharacterized protein YjbI with pentapeptide repeats